MRWPWETRAEVALRRSAGRPEVAQATWPIIERCEYLMIIGMLVVVGCGALWQWFEIAGPMRGAGAGMLAAGLGWSGKTAMLARHGTIGGGYPIRVTLEWRTQPVGFCIGVACSTFIGLVAIVGGAAGLLGHWDV